LEDQCVITRKITVAGGVFAPGHLGELTQVLDFALVDAVAQETATVQKRVRLLPTRVVVFFVLALALFEKSAYRQVWGKLVAGLDGVVLAWPSVSALTRARRRVGPKPLRALFDAVSGPVARPSTPGVFWRGLRLTAIDATSLACAGLGAYRRGLPQAQRRQADLRLSIAAPQRPGRVRDPGVDRCGVRAGGRR